MAHLKIKIKTTNDDAEIFLFFHRTTTPNSLREHLKETLTKNLEGSDIAETIQVPIRLHRYYSQSCPKTSYSCFD